MYGGTCHARCRHDSAKSGMDSTQLLGSLDSAQVGGDSSLFVGLSRLMLICRIRRNIIIPDDHKMHLLRHKVIVGDADEQQVLRDVVTFASTLDKSRPHPPVAYYLPAAVGGGPTAVQCLMRVRTAVGFLLRLDSHTCSLAGER